MNTISVSVRIKERSEKVNLILFQKIYSTPYGIVNHWSTNKNSDYRLEVIIDEDDLSVNPMKITKALNILTDETEIADQIIIELYGTKSLYKTHFLI
ncbi:MAG: hypothetical protein KAR57_02885 [Bacteroidales bacterium]|nr:hypothetical protein [Bacteroidales bacterium]